MLEYFYVDGFRSLKNFELQINPGINVLVGPNGSGKTNIFRFFEFLSNVSNNKIMDAIGLSGGTSAIFDRAEAKSKSQEISVKLKGNTSSRSIEDNLIYKISYYFEFCVRLDKDNSIINYNTQTIQLRAKRETGKGKELSIDIDFRNGEIIQSEFKNSSILFLMGLSDEQLSKFIKTDQSIFLENSIISFLAQFGPHFREVLLDINTGKAYNINPESVRQIEDISREPQISTDGSGLAATLAYLHKISKENNKGNELLFYQRRYINNQEKHFNQIVSMISLINNDIVDLISSDDIIENRVNISALFRGEGRDIEIPMKFLSDGTIKWIAIITAIVTSRNIFSIEEPENFLHPKMQREFVEFLRGSTSRNTNSFSLITTHSETLINCLRPEEIILTKYVSGYTSADRILDPESITDEINQTGFGLGWYYNTGILDA
ncbi:MAG: AAA family ATPase [Labrenzia sp.]